MKTYIPEGTTEETQALIILHDLECRGKLSYLPEAFAETAKENALLADWRPIPPAWYCFKCSAWVDANKGPTRVEASVYHSPASRTEEVGVGG